MRLTYKRTTLIGLAALVAGLAIVGVLISLEPVESRRGVARLLIGILGPQGFQLFLGAISVVMLAGALRLAWLAFGGALAAQLGPRGIEVRSIYYAGLIPWKSVRAVDCRTVSGWSAQPLLVIERNDGAGLFSRLVGLGSKAAIQRKFLDAADHDIAAWIEAAQNRDHSPHSARAAPAVAPAPRTFGRRQL